MTDREWLILAAMAAHNEPMSWCDAEYFTEGLLSGWNPLENNGDAFSLMVTLGLSLQFLNVESLCMMTACTVSWVPGGEKNRTEEFLLEINDDPNAAVRRAIVRAAGTIGSRMISSRCRNDWEQDD